MLLEWRARDYPERAVDKMDLFFDRDEHFLKHLYKDWTDKRILKRYPFYALISCMAPMKMCDSPGLQAADLLAWSTHRLLGKDKTSWLYKIAHDAVQATESWHLYFGAQRLEEYVNGLAKDYFHGLPPSW